MCWACCGKHYFVHRKEYGSRVLNRMYARDRFCCRAKGTGGMLPEDTA